MEPVPLMLHSPIMGKSQKRAVVLHGHHKMMVVRTFDNSGLTPS